jgi:hypothetical protein
VALHEAEAGAVGLWLHGGRGADRHIVDALQPVCRLARRGVGWEGMCVEEEAKAVERRQGLGRRWLLARHGLKG